jgi:hypothetical protein
VAEDNPTDKSVTVQKPDLQADRTWYNSLFTQLLAPLVATRYMWLAVEEINPLDFLKKKDSLVADGKIPAIGRGPEWSEPVTHSSKVGRYISRNFAAFGIGSVVLGIIGMYSKNTLNDMKSVYAEAVGYELGKKPEDVSYSDLFLRSKNEALGVTRDAYARRTLMRLATAATFFVPWHKFRGFKELKPEYTANANVGVGAIGVHLLAEGFMRKPSFFDIEQRMISSKINHKDVYSMPTIQPQDIQSLMMLQARHMDSNYMPPSGASEEGQQNVRLTERIADLMNQTYNNSEHKEKAHFTIGKLNYLIGFRLLDKFPESMAYVELANRSADMQDVKEVREAIKSGEDPKAVFARHGVDMQALAQPAPEKEPAAEESPTHAKHVDKIHPKTHHEFATHIAEGPRAI